MIINENKKKIKKKKKKKRHKAVAKNILFQDSVYLFSFEQSACAQAGVFSLPVASTCLI